ncbi:MAG: DUF4440 domain-containing protein [Ruminococcus sp.]|nr:DUF4440 domain-containing protein [Ruminococcus sp.]
MKILNCILALAICAALASCGANGSSSAASKEETSAAKTTVSETNSQANNTSKIIDPQTEISGYPEFDFDTKTVTLNSGYEMPILGIGCFSLSDEEAENSVYRALSDGYRLIDTARIYGNEEAVGRAISRAINDGIVTREEYFADIENGSLRYFTIGIDSPEVVVSGDTASVTYTSVLNANAYGAKGTYRMKGTHHYKKRDGEWIAVNAPK